MESMQRSRLSLNQKKLKIYFIKIVMVFFMFSCSGVKRNYFLIPNSENSASIEVIRKILFVEKYLINYPKNYKTLSKRTINEIECLSGICSSSSGTYFEHKRVTKEVVNKWKIWYDKNSKYFRYPTKEEFDECEYEVFLSLPNNKKVILTDKIIILDNPKNLVKRNSLCK